MCVWLAFSCYYYVASSVLESFLTSPPLPPIDSTHHSSHRDRPSQATVPISQVRVRPKKKHIPSMAAAVAAAVAATLACGHPATTREAFNIGLTPPPLSLSFTRVHAQCILCDATGSEGGKKPKTAPLMQPMIPSSWALPRHHHATSYGWAPSTTVSIGSLVRCGLLGISLFGGGGASSLSCWALVGEVVPNRW